MLLTGSDLLAQDILQVPWRDVFDRAHQAGELRHDATGAERVRLLEKIFPPAFGDVRPRTSWARTWLLARRGVYFTNST